MKLLVVQCFLFQNSTSYKNIFGSLAMRSGKYSSTKIAFSPILVPKNRSKISSKKQSYWTDRNWQILPQIALRNIMFLILENLEQSLLLGIK